MANTKVTGDVIANGTISTVHLADDAITSDKITGITTAHITEGSNLYYTDTRVRAAITVNGNALSYDSSTGVITSNYEESPTFTGNITFGDSHFIGDDADDNLLIQSSANENIIINSVDDLFLRTGGTTKLIVKNAGNVGIGTTSPDTKLHISGGDPSIRLTPGDSNDARVDFTDSGGTVRWYTGYDISSGNLVIAADESGFGSSNIMVMNDSGNIGIGVTNPSDYYSAANDLVVGGSSNHGITIATGTTSTGALHFADGTTGTAEYAGYIAYQHNDNKMRFGINASDKLIIDSDGNVGIGTTLPNVFSNQTSLTINGTNNSRLDLKIGNAQKGAVIASTNEMILDAGASPMQFYTGNTLHMLINTSGNVGIGITTPSSLLHLLGADATVEIQGSGTSSTAGVNFFPRDGSDVAHLQSIKGVGSSLTFLTGGNSGNSYVPTERMRIDSSGNVGIGATETTVGGTETQTSTATPTRMLFNNNYSSGYTDASLKLYLFNYQTTRHGFTSGPNYDLQYHSSGHSTYAAHTFYTNNNFVMRVGYGDTTNVGIGTTSPSRKLYVGGAALIDGIGNTNKGTLMLGPQTGGVGKWSVITGAHYNATSGSGNGSGSAGIMMIGTFAGNGENDVVIGGNIYEANAATSIQFWTHTTDTSTAGGTRRMIITSNGNVGMGSVAFTPATGLHLYYQNSADMGSVLTLGNNGCCVSNRTGVGFKDGSYYRSGIVFETSGTNSYAGHIIFKKSSNSTTLDGTSETMRIHSNGNVGIGVANPQFEKLEVAGNIKANDVNGKFYTNAYSFANADTYSDTVSVSGHCLYEYIIEVNPNSAGSGLYADYYYGKVGIGVGWNGSAVTQYIFQDADETAPRSLYPSGGGNISITARMIYSGGVYTELAQGTTCTIRFQGFSTASYGIIYLRRLA